MLHHYYVRASGTSFVVIIFIVNILILCRVYLKDFVHNIACLLEISHITYRKVISFFFASYSSIGDQQIDATQPTM